MIRWTGGAGDVARIKYGYDYAGNRQWREDVVAATNGKNHDEYYTYDGLHRLAAVDRGNLTGNPYNGVTSASLTQDWTLDQLGNWGGLVTTDGTSTTLNQTRYHNAVNEIDGNGGNSITGTPNWADPQYDDAGNMKAMPLPASLSTSATLTYDAWNRLVGVSAGSYANTTIKYDGLGRRISRKVLIDPGTFPPLYWTYDYYYDENWQLLEERRESDPDPLAQYIWHPYYIDALAVRYYDASVSGSQTLQFYCQDANYNVTTVTNSVGAVEERYSYTPYGEITVLNPDFSLDSSGGGDGKSDIGNAHLYTGRELDRETGLQLNRHRYFTSCLGRWLSRDTFGVRGSGNNLYEYVEGIPLTLFDPLGLFGMSWCSPPPPCVEEVECVFVAGPWDCLMGNSCRSEANDAVNSSGLPGPVDGPADAFRHCYWTCCMAKNTNPKDAKDISDFHEACAWRNVPSSGQTKGRECMDKHNNDYGILGAQGSDCYHSCMSYLQSGELQTSPGCP